MIYLDHNATTPVDPRVLEAMTPFFTEQFGNPASRHHALGCDAARTVETAREQVASVIGADPREIVWTSGAGTRPSAPASGPASGGSVERPAAPEATADPPPEATADAPPKATADAPPKAPADAPPADAEVV